MNKELHFSSKTNEWATPQDFFDMLNKEFKFNLDPSATKENAKCKKFFTEKENGLLQSWGGVQRVLQSAVWTWVKTMGQKSFRRIKETKYNYCYVDTRTNMHFLFSRLYLQQSGNSIYSRTSKIWRFKKRCAVPFYGCSI